MDNPLLLDGKLSLLKIFGLCLNYFIFLSCDIFLLAHTLSCDWHHVHLNFKQTKMIRCETNYHCASCIFNYKQMYEIIHTNVFNFVCLFNKFIYLLNHWLKILKKNQLCQLWPNTSHSSWRIPCALSLVVSFPMHAYLYKSTNAYT